MPRRNEKIKSDQAFWIMPKGKDKGYSVFSVEQLNRLIERGEITAEDRVQIRQSKGV